MSEVMKLFSARRPADSFGHGFKRIGIIFAVALIFSVSASAQYGGGGGGTGGSGTGTYSTAGRSYGNGKAIGIGVGAAAAGGLGLYLALHHGSSVTGCVQPAEDGLRLTDDKTQRTFSVMPGSADVRAGERVQLKGKISKDKDGNQVLETKNLVKDFGACGALTSNTGTKPPSE